MKQHETYTMVGWVRKGFFISIYDLHFLTSFLKKIVFIYVFCGCSSALSTHSTQYWEPSQLFQIPHFLKLLLPYFIIFQVFTFNFCIGEIEGHFSFVNGVHICHILFCKIASDFAWKLYITCLLYTSRCV